MAKIQSAETEEDPAPQVVGHERTSSWPVLGQDVVRSEALGIDWIKAVTVSFLMSNLHLVGYRRRISFKTRWALYKESQRKA